MVARQLAARVFNGITTWLLGVRGSCRGSYQREVPTWFQRFLACRSVDAEAFFGISLQTFTPSHTHINKSSYSAALCTHGSGHTLTAVFLHRAQSLLQPVQFNLLFVFEWSLWASAVSSSRCVSQSDGLAAAGRLFFVS